MKRPSDPSRPGQGSRATGSAERSSDRPPSRRQEGRSEGRSEARSDARPDSRPDSRPDRRGPAPASGRPDSRPTTRGGQKPASASDKKVGKGTEVSAGRTERGTDKMPGVPKAPVLRSDNRNTLAVGAVSAKYLQQGHAWVTQDKELGDTSRYRNGSIVSLVSPEGEFLAQALLEPEARIVARVLSRDPREHLSDEVFRSRALRALEGRKSLAESSTAYRIIHQEADGFPGLTIDRYGDFLVAQLYSPAALGIAHLALEALERTGHFAGAFLKQLPRDRRVSTEGTGTWIFGEPGPARFAINEYGIKFWVQPFQTGAGGLSTGLFLDMRENRRTVAALTRGKKVLNAFAYTGGFSLYCAQEGACVDTLDLSPKVVEQVRENFALNGISETDHRFITDDAFLYLARVAGKSLETTYDAIVLDPPTFSTSRDNTWSPGRITELNALAMAALPPQGLLITFSNFAQMSEAELLTALFDASLEARRPVQVLQSLQAGPDFPWLPGFPESRHLKGFVVRVL